MEGKQDTSSKTMMKWGTMYCSNFQQSYIYISSVMCTASTSWRRGKAHNIVSTLSHKPPIWLCSLQSNLFDSCSWSKEEGGGGIILHFLYSHPPPHHPLFNTLLEMWRSTYPLRRNPSKPPSSRRRPIGQSREGWEEGSDATLTAEPPPPGPASTEPRPHPLQARG